MRNLPLSVQIWLVFASITLIISLILIVIFPLTLRDFFTKEIFATIESAQITMADVSSLDDDLLRGNSGMQRRGQGQMMMHSNRIVNHLIISSQGIVNSSSLPADFLVRVQEQAEQQVIDRQRYSDQVGEDKIFYVITRAISAGEEAFLVSYMWDSYREDLVQTLFSRLVIILVVVFLLSWIPALGMARYLSRPLVILGEKVKKLSKREWQEPIILARSDEIGQLGDYIEQLRLQLLAQDEAQQSFLQNVSHELKTPVMVIRSYVQAIKDGIFPKGNLENSTEVIDTEALRLEKIISNLLYLNKLDYLASHQPVYAQIRIDRVIENVVERLRWQRPELNWVVQLTPLTIIGNVEQWVVVMENLLDNQIRYAGSKIEITLQKDINDIIESNKGLLHIYNDGPGIEEENLARIFDRFQIGKQGEFGLGLTIVSRVVAMHGGEIWAQNETAGVSFFVRLNLEA